MRTLTQQQVESLQTSWETESRWRQVRRPSSAEEVLRLRGSLHSEQTIAWQGAVRLWHLLQHRLYVAALDALTGNQAVQQVKAGLQAISVSGKQVAAAANLAGQMSPDQSLSPTNSVPQVVRKINQALQRADQIQCAEGTRTVDWYAPIVADAEGGFGGPLHAFERMKALIEAGAAGVHFADQQASENTCGPMGGNVLLPTQTAIKHLVAARLAADVLDVSTVLIARTDAAAATLITSDIDPVDQRFLTGERTMEGLYHTQAGLGAAIARGRSSAPYCDLLWCETNEPDLEEARRFADVIHAHFPGKMLAYHCSSSFNWRKKLDQETLATFQHQLGSMGYTFQCIPRAGFHTLTSSMFQLASDFRERGMTAYAALQQASIALEERGDSATGHQHEGGTGYFDAVAQVIAGGASTTTALVGSIEHAQCFPPLT